MRRASAGPGGHQVRIAEAELLSRPDLWTLEGLTEYLREHGIDPEQPYRQYDDEAGGWLFVQDRSTVPLAA